MGRVPRCDRLDDHRDRRTQPAGTPDLPPRLPARLCPCRRETPRRPSPATLPALATRPRRDHRQSRQRPTTADPTRTGQPHRPHTVTPPTTRHPTRPPPPAGPSPCPSTGPPNSYMP